MSSKFNKQSDLIIASFVPALLRNQFEKFPSRTPKSELIGDHAVLLWIDICSFSPLSNRLLLDQEKGVEQLSKILQEHYDFVLNLIVKYGGEPMVFAGDGVFAAWPCKEEELFSNAEIVCACAQEVLENKGAKDDLGNPLSLHVVAACGSCELLELGGIDGRWLYTVLGEALNDLSLTAKNREPGNILLSSSILKVLDGKYKNHPVKHNSAVLDEKVKATARPDKSDIYLHPQSIATLKSFLPSPISKKLDFDRLKWIDELRNVTIVFTQLHSTEPNSSAASERLQKAIEIITPVVVKYDGILNQVWIDEKAANILIIFGPPPSAHSDNPVRGLLTAIETKKVLTDSGFVNSVGVSSGKAFCGILGNDILRQYTVIGDVVNLGARLAQLQLKNVCCDETTMKASRDEFTFTQPKMVIIKGLVKKEQIWELESSSIKNDDNDLEIPVVGRNNELSLFHICFSRAQSGEGVSLILEGESGLGKTKLLSSFQSLMEADGQLVLTGSGDPLERGNPYFVWRAIFSKMMGLDKLPADKDKTEVILKFLGEEFSSLISLLNILFVSDFPESEHVRSLSVQQKVAETKKLLLNLLSREAKKNTLIILIDNSVWLDDASWKFALAVSADIKRCFTVISVQSSEGVKEIGEWKSSGAIFYQLKGLSEKDQLSLIKQTFSVKHVDDEITSSLISLSKGNPFFCFELIQALIDDEAVSIQDGGCQLSKGISLDKFRLPETIQGTLSRRIDSLDQGPKLALKIASVTGMRFSTELVKNIFPITQERTLVPDFLSKDNKMGLLWQDMIDGSQGYTFNNAITREVAYEMLLFNQKKELHSEIARWYEVNYKNNLTPFYTRLAFHWEKAGKNAIAVDYLQQQAIRLFSIGFAKQSVEIGLKALKLLDIDFPITPQEIGPKIGWNMAAIGQLMAGRDPLELLELKKLDDPKIEQTICLLLEIGPFAFQSQQIELFALISVTGLRITLEHGSGKAVADVYSLYSIIYNGMTGDHIGAYKWSELALKADLKNQNTYFPRVGFVHTWFHNHWVNPFSTSLPLALKAADNGFASGDILFACFNLSGYVVYLTACGKPLQEVMDYARLHLSLNNKRVMNAAFHLILELQFAKALAGSTNEYLSLTDEEYIEEKDISSICSTELSNQVGYCLVARVKLHTHFGKWSDALDWAEQVKPLLKAFEGQIAEIDLVQYSAIAALTGVLKGNFDSYEKLMGIATESLDKMQSWADICPQNFKHKALILEAFLEGTRGDFNKAEEMFSQAASLAEAGEFLNDAAQLQECRLILQQSKNKKLTALEAALMAYEKWGAYGKVAYLQKNYSEVLS